ncbi:MAG TPA: phenylalanine 4-monooxygenase [Chitinophagales bacterium]|nr:phenylalanine 4-monooxygenase [Chitinophagales bacterium]
MLQQEYDKYAPEHFTVWQTLFEKQINNLHDTVTQKYMDGLEKINFTADRIPDFTETNALLEKHTSWHIQAVPGIIPDRDFFMLLNRRRFPATCWLRNLSQLNYIEEPDMFHDVFGHIPLLTDQHFCDFLHGLSEIALQHIDNPYAIELMSRIYWFTIEFGLIQEGEKVKIYGAGIISSSGETEYSLGPEPARHNFDVAAVLNSAFHKDKMQQQYFVIQSFEELYHCLPQLQRLLGAMLATAPQG